MDLQCQKVRGAKYMMPPTFKSRGAMAHPLPPASYAAELSGIYASSTLLD